MSWKNTILAMMSFSTSSSRVFPVHLDKSKFTRLAEMSKQDNGRDRRRENRAGLRVSERRRRGLEKTQQRKTKVNAQVRYIGVGGSGRVRDSKMKYRRSSGLYNNNNTNVVKIHPLNNG